jgi:hypothetical protein
MTSLRFIPRDRQDLPAFEIEERREYTTQRVSALRTRSVPTGHAEYVFRVLDVQATVHVETFHATLPDALQQVTSSMRTYCPSTQQYDIEGELL